jgi:hypothetical protein
VHLRTRTLARVCHLLSTYLLIVWISHRSFAQSITPQRFLLLLWSLGGNFFSAWTLADCRFLYVNPVYLPTILPDADNNGSSLRQTRYTGYVGLFTIQTETTETIESIPDYSSSWVQCEEISGEITDELDMKFRIARLMGVIGLTCGGVASLVMLLNFCMEACCVTSGVQYGLGVMYGVAVVTQGLTFLGVDGRNCRDYGCVISSTATWSILACCLYFIALVHAFTVPFPRERICSSEVCCACCGKDEDEQGGDRGDEEAAEKEADDEALSHLPEEDDDLAKAAVAGAAAGAGGAAVVAAVADNDSKGETFVDEEGTAGTDGTAGAVTALDAEKDLNVSASADATATSENCATMASNLIGSAIAACASAGGADTTEVAAPAEPTDAK